MDTVTLEGVTKTFGSFTAVRDVDLHVPPGSVYGFIGPNGSGKTTTLRMIMGILYPDRGVVRVLQESSAAAVRDRVGYLPEERGMYRKMRVGDLLTFYGRLKGTEPATLRRRIDDWLERMDLLAWKGRKIEELSKGMGQKIQFVATVLHEPELLILDEPFSGLDPVNMEFMARTVLEWRRQGRTVIFSTHVMEQAEKLCDHVFMIFRGTKVLDGTIDEIRAAFREDTLEVTGDGDLGAAAGHPHVRALEDLGNGAAIHLRPGADPQEVLRALLPAYRLRRFELRTPTLHDIFLRIAGDGATEGDAR